MIYPVLSCSILFYPDVLFIMCHTHTFTLLCNSQFFFVVVYSHIDHASLFLDHILDHPPGT